MFGADREDGLPGVRVGKGRKGKEKAQTSNFTGFLEHIAIVLRACNRAVTCLPVLEVLLMVTAQDVPS